MSSFHNDHRSLLTVAISLVDQERAVAKTSGHPYGVCRAVILILRVLCFTSGHTDLELAASNLHALEQTLRLIIEIVCVPGCIGHNVQAHCSYLPTSSCRGAGARIIVGQ